MTYSNSTSWKLRLGSLGLGLLVAGMVFGTALALSEDLRLFYLGGALLLFGGAFWLGTKSSPDWISALLLCLPLAGVFSFFVLPQLPSLWPNLLLWALVAATGILSASPVRGIAKAMAVLVLLSISAWYCTSYIPNQMKRVMNRSSEGAAPDFSFQAVSDGAVPTTATPGRVLVIDFFGTWCAPCKAELPELELIRRSLQGKRDIEFVIVATNSGGDTPERLRAFGQRQHVTIPLAFDPQGKAHTAFGLTGYPGLVVIDRAGRVRLIHEGYNSSETSFRSDLTQLLETL